MAESHIVQDSRLLDLPTELLELIAKKVGQPSLIDLPQPEPWTASFFGSGQRVNSNNPNAIRDTSTAESHANGSSKALGPTEADCIVAKTSLRALRLTSRACVEPATQWLFASRTVHTSYEGVNGLDQILNSRLAKYVRHITLASDSISSHDFYTLQKTLSAASHIQSLTIETRMDVFQTQMATDDNAPNSCRFYEARIADAVSHMTPNMLRSIKLSVHDSGIAGRFFSYGRPDGDGAQWNQIFGQIRTLDVSIYKRQYRPSEMWRGRTEGELLLQHPLSLMPNLEHLRLKLFALTGAGASTGPDQPIVPPTIVLNSLKTLDLGRCTVSAWVLVDIFTKSCQSLVKVSLKEMPLTSGSWEEALTVLAGSSSLIETDFAGLYYSEVTEEDYQYPGGAFGGDGVFYEPIQQDDVHSCRQVFLSMEQNRKRLGLSSFHSPAIEEWLERTML